MSVQVCHSEADARQRWCQFAQGCGKESGGNRMPYGSPDDDPVADDDARVEYGADMATLYPCIASDCMAWRWVETHIHNPAEPKGDLIPSGDTHGYCGLAGDPKIALRA